MRLTFACDKNQAKIEDKPSGRAVGPFVVLAVLGVWGGVGGCWTEDVDEVLNEPIPTLESTGRVWPSAPDRPMGETAPTFELCCPEKRKCESQNLKNSFFSPHLIVIHPMR